MHQPEPVMINEYDITIVDSDNEEEELAFLGKFKTDLYNLKREIKVDR